MLAEKNKLYYFTQFVIMQKDANYNSYPFQMTTFTFLNMKTIRPVRREEMQRIVSKLCIIFDPYRFF